MSTYVLSPPNFSPIMHVSGTYVFCKNKLLALHRHPDKPYGDQWCIPGGKEDPGDTPLTCAQRELQQETGIGTSALVHCAQYSVRYPDYDFVYNTFRTTLSQQPTLTLSPKEHIAYRWVTPAEFLALTLVPLERECALSSLPDYFTNG